MNAIDIADFERIPYMESMVLPYAMDNDVSFETCAKALANRGSNKDPLGRFPYPNFKPFEIYQWLSPLFGTFETKFKVTLAERVLQTASANLRFQSEMFQSWLNGSGSCTTLWCIGIHGTGKTVFASLVIDYLLRRFNDDDGVGISYIYLTYQRTHDKQKRKMQMVVNIIADMLQQLARQLVERGSYAVQFQLAKLYDQHHDARNTRPTLDELISALQDVIGCFSKVYLVIDALDERAEEEVGYELLSIIQSLQQDKICLLATSRYEPPPDYDDGSTSQLNFRASNDDISSYIGTRIHRSKVFRDYVTKDLAFENKIKETIIAKADGIFLIARLHMDSLLQPVPTTLARAKTRLSDLPARLHENYDRIMERIEAQGLEWASMARKTLGWVFYAFEPLTIAQIQDALSVEVGNTTLNKEDIPEQSMIVGACAEMIAVQPDTNIVSFNHYTFREYLASKEYEIFPEVEAEITQACLTYLLSTALNGPAVHDEDMNDRMDRYSLLRYAALCWGEHASNCSTVDFADLAIRFLDDDALISSSIQAMQMGDLGVYEGYSQDFDRNVSGLWLAAYFGLTDLVRALHHNGLDLEQRTSDGDTALHVAMRNGHETTVKILLECGADVHGLCTTEQATQRDMSSRITKTILDAIKKSDRDVSDIFIGHVLGSETELENTIQQLRTRGCDIADAAPRDTALHIAAEKGEYVIAKLLLDHGADPNARGEDSLTTIEMAVRGNHDLLAQLLKKRANAAVHGGGQ